MSFLKKIFSPKLSKDKEIKGQPVNLSLDDSFVHNFINKGGKFLYCTSMNEVTENIKNIFIENKWEEVLCSDIDLLKLITTTNVIAHPHFNNQIPFFSSCEHLISNSGDILFSSNQLGSYKIATFSENFIIYATTSQLVKDTSEGLTGIRSNYRGNIPTNISSIKKYSIEESNNDTLETGNCNSKKLYLILFEDF